MTAQAMDIFIYQGQEHSLLGMDKEGFVKPQDFGMTPEAASTACYRGFVSTCEITDGGLYLKEMTLSAKNGVYKPINGVWPTMDTVFPGANYKDINLLVRYSGRIRLGAGFIEDLYVHQGFQKPSAFRTVIDLKFEGGRVIDVVDRSADAEAIRGQFKKRHAEMGRGILRIWRFIKKAYSQDMDEFE